jgi:hypothetical protein
MDAPRAKAALTISASFAARGQSVWTSVVWKSRCLHFWSVRIGRRATAILVSRPASPFAPRGATGGSPARTQDPRTRRTRTRRAIQSTSTPSFRERGCEADPAFGVIFVVFGCNPPPANSGATGYSTFTGRVAPIAARPRPSVGTPCEPIRFTVEEPMPDWVYIQVAVVVGEARGDGIDVALETR